MIPNGPSKKKKNQARPKRPLYPETMESEQLVMAGDLYRIPKGFDRVGLANQIYRVRRVVDTGSITQTATAPVFGSLNFQLGSVDSSTDFTQLFDVYRIKAVIVRLRPQFNMAALGVPTSTILPLLYTVIDYDDSTAPATVSEMRQFSTIKETRFDQDHVRAFKPRIAVAAYSGTFTSYANVGDTWIDCNSNSVQHYGLKYGITGGAGSQTNLQSWTIECEYLMEFKMTR